MANQWYYAKDDQQYGPVSDSDLRQLAASGVIGPRDMVWREGMADWKAAKSIGGLFAPPPQAIQPVRAAPPFQPVRAAPPFQPVRAPSAQAARAAPAPAPSTFAEPVYDLVADPSDARALEPVTPVAAQPVYDQPGHAPLPYQGPSQETVWLSPKSLDMLRQTRPWVRFISLIMLIGGALYLVIGLIGLFVSLAGPTSSRRGAGYAEGYLVGQFIGMALASTFLIASAHYLGRFGTKIRDVLAQRRPEDLEAALEAQKSYWRLTGIVTIVGLGLFVLVLFIAFAAATMR